MAENQEIKLLKEQIKLEKIKQNKKTKRLRWFIIGFFFGLILCIGSYICIKRDIIKSDEIKQKLENVGIELEDKNVKIYDISSRIKEMGDLITAEVENQYVLEFKDDNSDKWHALFTSKEILLLYTAKVGAGVDLTKAEVMTNGNRVLVTIPKATIKYTTIEPESIKTYDTKQALPLVSIDDKELLVDALEKAYDHASNSTNTTSILTFAQKQAKVLIDQLIKSINEEYEVEIRFVTIATESNIA